MKGLRCGLVSTQIWFLVFFSPPILSGIAYNCLIQPLLPFGKGIRAFQKFFLQMEKDLPSQIGDFAKNDLKSFICIFFSKTL